MCCIFLRSHMRAEYVIEKYSVDVCDALEKMMTQTVGKKMYEACHHVYQVSCEELDFLTMLPENAV